MRLVNKFNADIKHNLPLIYSSWWNSNKDIEDYNQVNLKLTQKLLWAQEKEQRANALFAHILRFFVMLVLCLLMFVSTLQGHEIFAVLLSFIFASKSVSDKIEQNNSDTNLYILNILNYKVGIANDYFNQLAAKKKDDCNK